MKRQEKIDVEFKGMNTEVLFGFELLCKKENKIVREELVNFMKQAVDVAIKNNILTIEEIHNYNPTIEEY